MTLACTVKCSILWQRAEHLITLLVFLIYLKCHLVTLHSCHRSATQHTMARWHAVPSCAIRNNVDMLYCCTLQLSAHCTSILVWICIGWGMKGNNKTTSLTINDPAHYLNGTLKAPNTKYKIIVKIKQLYFIPYTIVFYVLH